MLTNLGKTQTIMICMKRLSGDNLSSPLRTSELTIMTAQTKHYSVLIPLEFQPFLREIIFIYFISEYEYKPTDKVCCHGLLVLCWKILIVCRVTK